MYRLATLLFLSLFWLNAQAFNTLAPFPGDTDSNCMTIIHDKESDGKDDGKEEEEPDCE